MICPYCGNNTPDGSEHCSICGKETNFAERFSSTPAKRVPVPGFSKPTSVGCGAPAVQQKPDSGKQQAYRKTQNLMRPSIWIFVAGIVLIAVLVFTLNGKSRREIALLSQKLDAIAATLSDVSREIDALKENNGNITEQVVALDEIIGSFAGLMNGITDQATALDDKVDRILESLVEMEQNILDPLATPTPTAKPEANEMSGDNVSVDNSNFNETNISNIIGG